MFNPTSIKSYSKHSSFRVGEARKRAAAEHLRRAGLTKTQRENEDANTEALVMAGQWQKENYDRAVGLVGKKQFFADWHDIWGDTINNEFTPLEIMERIKEYDRYLNTLEVAGGIVENQKKIIRDDIDLALEQGDTAKAEALRDLLSYGQTQAIG